MANRTTLKSPTTGTDFDLMTDERQVAALSDNVLAKVQYFAEIDGTPDSPNVAVVEGDGSKRMKLLDGNLVTLGAKADAAWDGAAAAPTAHAVFKYIASKLEAARALLAGTLTISNASDARRTVSTTVTLAADTVGYTAGDALGAIFTLAALSRLGSQSVVVAHVKITTNNSAFTPTLRVQWFNANAAGTASDVADNAPFVYLTADENGVWQGFIDLPPMSTSVGSPTFAQAFDAFEHAVVTDASGNLYGQLTTVGAISAKTSGQILTITVTVREK